MNFIETIYSKILLMNRKKFSLNDVAKFTGLNFGFDKRTLAGTLERYYCYRRSERYNREHP